MPVLDADEGDPVQSSNGPQTLDRLIGAWADVAPGDEMVRERDGRRRSVTVREMSERSVEVAAGLSALGASPERPVAVWLPNRLEWVETLVGTARLDTAVIGVNTRFKTDELSHILQRSGAGVLVVADEFAGIDFAGIVRSADIDPALQVVVVGDSTAGWDGIGCAIHPWDDVTAPDDDRQNVQGRAGGTELLVAFTTSGTTGFPKLAAHDQATTMRHALADASAFDVQPGDRFLIDLPLCGAFGFNTLMCAIAGRATTLLNERFDPTESARALATEGVTHCNASDDMFVRILDSGLIEDGNHRWRQGAFANFTNAGPNVAERAERELGVRLTGVYGASEVFALLSRWPQTAPLGERSRAGGIPVDPGIEVRVIDPESGEQLGPEAEGELCFRGYPVMARYLGDPKATAAALDDDGWLRSGDLGRLAADGFEYLARLGDSLRLRGFLVDPAEIERRLEQHPAVELAQVVGADRPGRGQVAVAFVRTAGAVSEAELRDFCAAGIADLKVPQRIVPVDEFPTVEGPNGTKIMKRELRTQAAELVAAGR